MDIYGLQKNTLIDYPGKVACIIFTGGCNFKCPFCYSKEIVNCEVKKLQEEKVFEYLNDRKDLIDAVVLCGGEPTINKDLKEFAKKVKDLGYLVKLDTNGTNPDTVKDLIDNKLIDYVAMDIKGPKAKYANLSGSNTDIQNIEKTIQILKNSNTPHEFRTTVVPTLLEKKDFVEIADWIGDDNTHYCIQGFLNDKELMDKKLNEVKPYPTKYLKEIKEEIKHKFKKIDIR